MFSKIFYKAAKLAGKTAIAVALLGVFFPFAAVQPVHAATTDENTSRHRLLERSFQIKKNQYEIQELRFENADLLRAEVVDRIAELKDEGKDTTDLEAALEVFDAEMAIAEKFHGEAKATLDVHAGFDANGKVIDEKAATETVHQAGEQLRDAAQSLQDASSDLREALRDWRQDNRPVQE